MSSGTFNLNTGTLRITNATGSSNRDYNQSGGTFNYNTGTVELNITTGSANITVVAAAGGFYNFTTSGTHFDFNIETSFTVNNNLTFSNSYNHGTVGVQTSTSQIITVLGNVSKTSGDSTVDPDITIKMAGAGVQTASTTLGGAGRGLGSFQNSNTSNPITLTGNFQVRGDLTIDLSAELDVSASNYTVTCRRSFILNGTFTPRSGLVKLDKEASAAADIVAGSGTWSLYDFEIGGSTPNNRITKDVTIANNFTHSNTYNHATLAVTTDAPHTFSVAGNVAKTGDLANTPANLTINMNGATAQTIDQTGVTTRGYGILKISNTSATVTALSNLSFVGAGSITVDASAEFNIGTFDLSRWDGSGTTAFTVNGTLALDGDTVFTNVATPTLGAASTVKFNATSGSRAIFNWAYANLEIDGVGGTFLLGVNTTLTADLTITNGTLDTDVANNYSLNCVNYTQTGGTLLLRASTMTCSGNFDNTSNNGVTPGTSTVILTGTGTVQNVSSSGTPGFHNLTCAYPTKTTTITGNSSMRYKGDLHLGNGVTAGTLTASGFKTLLTYKNTTASISADSGYTFSVSNFRFEGDVATGFDYQTARISVNSSITVTQLGAITADFLQLAPSNNNSPVWNTANFALTLPGSAFNEAISCGGAASSNATFNAGSSVLILGIGGILVGGSTSGSTFNCDTATIDCSGDIVLGNGTAVLDLDGCTLNLSDDIDNSAGGTITAGTSLVTLDGTGAQNIDLGGGAFNDVVVTNTGGTVAFTSALTAAELTTSAGTSNIAMTFSNTGTHTLGTSDIDGIGTNRTELHSDSPGSQFDLTITNTSRGMIKADIQDCNFTGGDGGDLHVFGGTNSGNNVNVVFHGGGFRTPSAYGSEYRTEKQISIYRKEPVST